MRSDEWMRWCFLPPLVGLVACTSADIIITAGPDPSGRSEVRHMIRSHSGQQSDCQSGAIRQIVTHANCKSKEIENQVCAGSCFSYSLPRVSPEAPGDGALDFCESCQPLHTSWLNVTLECVADDETPYEVSKEVQYITNCTCTVCPGTPHYNPIITQEFGNEDEQRISKLLYRALPQPPAEEREETNSDDEDAGVSSSSSLPPTLSVLTSATSTTTEVTSGTTVTPPPSEIPTRTTMTLSYMSTTTKLPDAASDLSKSDSTTQSSVDSNRGPYYEFPGPIDLEGEEVVIKPAPEEERDPNVLGAQDSSPHFGPEDLDDSSNLADLMTNLNAIKYEGMSINELKSALNKLKREQASKGSGRQH